VGPLDCSREQDVLDALASRRWPARCDEDLRAHVAECEVCRDIAEAVGPVLQARDRTWDSVRVPTAATVWWRAQTRARLEAAREAASPITVAEIAGASAALLVLAAVVWASAAWLNNGLLGVAQWVAAVDLPAIGLPSIELPSLDFVSLEDLARWRWLAVAIVAWLVIAPLALYLAMLED
jgi:hypothetical protein